MDATSYDSHQLMWILGCDDVLFWSFFFFFWCQCWLKKELHFFHLWSRVGSQNASNLCQLKISTPPYTTCSIIDLFFIILNHFIFLHLLNPLPFSFVRGNIYGNKFCFFCLFKCHFRHILCPHDDFFFFLFSFMHFYGYHYLFMNIDTFLFDLYI